MPMWLTIICIIVGIAIYNIGKFFVIKYLIPQPKIEANLIVTSPIPDKLDIIEKQLWSSNTNLVALKATNETLPQKILETIQGSISNNKGKVAELIAYLQLKAEYDRIIPLGGIVDYIAIKFPSGDDPGEMVFIDIKSGNARLSTDQKFLKKIIEANKIGFQKMTIDTSDVLNATTDNNSGSNSELQ